METGSVQPKWIMDARRRASMRKVVVEGKPWELDVSVVVLGEEAKTRCCNKRAPAITLLL